MLSNMHPAVLFHRCKVVFSDSTASLDSDHIFSLQKPFIIVGIRLIFEFLLEMLNHFTVLFHS